MDTQTEYIDAAEVAKYVRTDLKQAFPGQRFRVRTSKYSGGASINVGWTDGPTTRQVEAVAKKYEGSDFDGMIDLKISNQHYRNPDGSIEFAGTEGSTGSRGVIPALDRAPSYPESTPVHLMADYVMCSRSYSQYDACVEIIGKRLCVCLAGCVYGPGWKQQRFGVEWLDSIAQGVLSNCDLRSQTPETCELEWRRI